MDSEQKVPLHILIEESLKRRLEAASGRERRSQTQIAILALERYLTRSEAEDESDGDEAAA